jgi:hypothetical protein
LPNGASAVRSLVFVNVIESYHAPRCQPIVITLDIHFDLHIITELRSGLGSGADDGFLPLLCPFRISRFVQTSFHVLPLRPVKIAWPNHDLAVSKFSVLLPDMYDYQPTSAVSFCPIYEQEVLHAERCSELVSQIFRALHDSSSGSFTPTMEHAARFQPSTRSCRQSFRGTGNGFTVIPLARSTL